MHTPPSDLAGQRAMPPEITTLPPKKRGTGSLAPIIVIIGLVFVFLLVLGYLATSLGGGAMIVCGLAALVPLGFVVLGAAWVDRWEPEPRLALLTAWLWGAAASVALTLLIQLPLVIASGGNGDEFIESVVSAPIIEESTKALGLALIFLIWRRTFDGPVDGIVYGMIIGAGFAFTENILYFGDALLNGDAALFTATFFTRGLLSPFAHAMFTAGTGFAMGLAVTRGRPVLLWGIAGLGLAALLHFLWNLSTFIDFYGLYILIQMPLFAACVVLISFLRRRERQRTEERLLEYAEAGWFSRDEVWLVATKVGRAQLGAWAERRGAGGRAASKRLVKDMTELSAVRDRVHSSGGRDRAARREAELLASITQTRQLLFAG